MDELTSRLDQKSPVSSSFFVYSHLKESKKVEREGRERESKSSGRVFIEMMEFGSFPEEQVRPGLVSGSY